MTLVIGLLQLRHVIIIIIIYKKRRNLLNVLIRESVINLKIPVDVVKVKDIGNPDLPGVPTKPFKVGSNLQSLGLNS